MTNTPPNTIGIDPSYTATGLATPTGTHVIKTKPADGTDIWRAAFIARQLHAAIIEHEPELIAIEAPVAYSHNGLRLGILHGIIRYVLNPFAHQIILAPPATLKKYATGKGNAPKHAVIAEAIRRLDYAGNDDNEADALWLSHLAAHLLGEPHVKLPAHHLTALEKLELP
jgi:Holliday junction resolvasome RuvABC endonuclease subunit